MTATREANERVAKAIRMLANGDVARYKDAAQATGLSPRTVSRRYRAAGHSPLNPSGGGRKIPDETYEKIHRLVMDENFTAVDACRREGINTSSYYNWRKSKNLPGIKRRTPKHGFRSPMTKRVLDILADGERHSRAELFEEAAKVITPGQALRQVERERVAQARRRGRTNTERTRSNKDTAYLIESGKKRLFYRYITDPAKRGYLPRVRVWEDEDTDQLWFQRVRSS